MIILATSHRPPKGMQARLGMLGKECRMLVCWTVLQLTAARTGAVQQALPLDGGGAPAAGGGAPGG